MIQTETLGTNSGALMVRFINEPGVRRAFINAPGTSAVWLAADDDGDGVFDFQQVLGPDEGIELPMDMVVSYDDAYLYVSNWFANTVQQFDISDPLAPELLATVSVPHPNMLRLSRDGSRLYVTNSLLTPWDNDADFGEPRNSDYGIWLFEVGSRRRPHTAPRRRQRLGQLRQRREADDHRPGRPAHDALRPERSARGRRALTEHHVLGAIVTDIARICAQNALSRDVNSRAAVRRGGRSPPPPAGSVRRACGGCATRGRSPSWR